MKIFVLLFVIGVSVSLTAQNTKNGLSNIDNTSSQAVIIKYYDNDYKRSDVFANPLYRFASYEAGTYSILVTFNEITGAKMIPPVVDFTMRKGSGKIAEIEDYSINGNKSFKIQYYRGIIDPVINENLVYRIPYPVGHDVTVTTCYKFIQLNRSEMLSSIPFTTFSSGHKDTVFAMRKGVIVELSFNNNSNNKIISSKGIVVQNLSKGNYLIVEHTDGTLAMYSGLTANDESKLKVGTKVFPDTYLGETGMLKDGIYSVSTCIYYPTRDRDKTSEKYTIKQAYIDPLYATDKGNIRLANQMSYKPAVYEAIITAEMSKKEAKEHQDRQHK